MKKMDHIRWSESFVYDLTSPTFLRKTDGSIAGWKHNKGYVQVRYGGKLYLAHRVIMCLHGVSIDGKQVDHEDRNKANGLFSNLRLATDTLNMHNKQMYANNTSGITGVIFEDSLTALRWRAQWKDAQGKNRTKGFPIRKLGNDEAFRQACAWRLSMLEQLNQQGAGYTDDHGTK